jgi:hypothetical protein
LAIENNELPSRPNSSKDMESAMFLNNLVSQQHLAIDLIESSRNPGGFRHAGMGDKKVTVIWNSSSQYREYEVHTKRPGMYTDIESGHGLNCSSLA